MYCIIITYKDGKQHTQDYCYKDLAMAHYNTYHGAGVKIELVHVKRTATGAEIETLEERACNEL